MNIPIELLSVFRARFINRDDCYYRQRTDGSGKYDCIKRPLTDSLIIAHLRQAVTLSVPITFNGMCKFICFDSDQEAGHIAALQCLFDDMGFPSYREAVRQGRDGHLWLFPSEQVSHATARIFAVSCLEAVGLTERDIEVFPKQKRPTAIGSGVRLPLGKNRKQSAYGAVGWFENAEKNIMSQLELVAGALQVVPAEEITVCARMAWREYRELAGQAINRPVCIQRNPPRVSTCLFATGQINFKDIAHKALLQSQQIIERWLPGGKGATNYVVLNPNRNDKNPGSFSINLKSGKWKDFATNDVKGSDLISLVAYLESCSQLEAARKLAGFLNSGVKV